MKHHHYTEKERQWLRNNCDSADSFQDLTERFNSTFGHSLKRDTIRDYCHKRLGLKNLKGSASTQFVKGSKPRALPIGTIRKSQTMTYIKVCESGKPMQGYAKPDWIPYQQYVLEQAHGKIKDNEFVIFLDSNTENFVLENLAVINRQISQRLCTRGWYTDNAELTRTGVMFCELEDTLGVKRWQ